MSRLPLPPIVGRLLDSQVPHNLSLWFDRGVNTYREGWQLGTAKAEFLNAFVKKLNSTPTEPYAHFVTRRAGAMGGDQVRSVKVTSTSRLVVGLGLPHPTETSILIDRLTGCPYLPGSSVKGLLRGAARLAAQGEFPPSDVDQKAVDFWRFSKSRIFGPAPGEPQYPASGEVVFYDAFPTTWPTLELDVMTPHYGPYYEGDETPPGDWFSPVPVTFLTIRPGCEFEFYFRVLRLDTREADQDAIRSLLPKALDWLGIGAKRSAGYGMFGEITQPVGEIARPCRRAAKHSEQVPVHKEPSGTKLRARKLGSPERVADAWKPPKPNTGHAGVIKREVVSLLSGLKNGAVKVRAADGQEVTCKGFSAYPPRKAGEACLADVTRVEGKATQAVFKGDA